MMTIQISDIIEKDRQRQNYPNIERLAGSILRIGLLEPIVLTPDKILVAGGRRKTALQMILNQQVPEEWTPDKIHEDIQKFIDSAELLYGVHYRTHNGVENEADREEAELAENIEREDISWQERVLAIERIHRLKVRQNALVGKHWGLVATAELIGSKAKKSQIEYATKVAKLLRENDREIWKCEGVTAAWRLITARKAAEGVKMLAKRQLDSNTSGSGLDEINFSPAPPPELPVNDDGEDVANEVLDSLFGQTEEAAVTTPTNEDASVVTKPTADLPVFELPFSKYYYQGNMVDLFQNITAPVCDHIITDPPYGIDMGNLEQTNKEITNLDVIKETHDADDNVNSFLPWIQTFKKMVRDGGYVVMWCDPWHFRLLCDLFSAEGFGVQRWPLVWAKTHNCINQSGNKNFTKSVEFAVVARKGNATLAKPASKCYWSGSNEAERKQLFGQPFVKPFMLWQWVAEHVALPGQTIADPFIGCGSSALALLEKGYAVLGSEIDELQYGQLRENILTYYEKKLTNNKVVLK